MMDKRILQVIEFGIAAFCLDVCCMGASIYEWKDSSGVTWRYNLYGNGTATIEVPFINGLMSGNK